MKPRVIIESPFSGDMGQNTIYARRCMADSLRRGEAPFASHLLYTQVLDDMNPEERELGLSAGLEWYASVSLCAVYVDRGLSGGMKRGMDAARRAGVFIEYRSLTTESPLDVLVRMCPDEAVS